ncbi:hypothetical protein KR222_005307 [Zaprionus bogoriensis]|nr:hypothetical protein KR222_005307 [Zaprionus bogoriensis]
MGQPKQQNDKILVTLIVLFLTSAASGFLLFPSSTILQITSSMSVPIDIPDRRKVFMDLGFQMNYNLPFDLASFYNPTIWSNALERRSRRNPYNFTGEAKQLLEIENGVHPSDFTAGELYAGLEHRLQDFGFHRSCLLRSVCELALHPLADNHSGHYSLIVQIITFMLTPSQHDGFGSHEKLYKHRYERAEQLGFLGGNCQRAYPKCELDVLTLMTRLVR